MKSKFKSHSHTTALAVTLAVIGLFSFLLFAAEAGTPDNTAVGAGALNSTTGTGTNNTATGYQALYKNATGNENTANGYQALLENTKASNNTASGSQSLKNNKGSFNIGLGDKSGYKLTNGSYNIDVGNLGDATDGTNPNSGVIRIGDKNQTRAFMSGIRNTTALSSTLPVVIDPNGQLGVGSGGGTPATDENRGNGNTAAEGVQALDSLTATGAAKNNTANGWRALYSNIAGSNNTANGVQALNSNAKGKFNTASGIYSLYSNVTGDENTATGSNALKLNSTGNDNTADGFQALYNTTGNKNTATGVNALLRNTIGNNNIALGYGAGNLTTGDNNIDIGNDGVAGEDRTIRIGDPAVQTRATFIAGISGVNQGSPTALYINTVTGQLGTTPSSRRFKKEIKPMDQTSEAILGLKPVTFHYKNDDANTPQFGLIAEEVEKVNPGLVVRDADGKVYSVRYDAVNAMLLNEFLKEHRKVEDQQTTITQLKATVAQQQKGMEVLTARVKEQEAQIQKVTERLDQMPSLPLQADNRQ